ncbi:tetratricopeptide repeat protein [bacterium]|nr:tetratricopeptide repeat protein [candidate division CSSED10-310 bacterium]
MQSRLFFHFGILITAACLQCAAPVRSAGESARESLVDFWEAQQRVLHDPRSGTMAIDSAKQAMLDLKLNSGVRHSSLLAALYASEATRLIDENQPDKAVWACRSALEMDPSYLPACRVLVIASARKSVVSFVSSMYISARTWFTAFKDPWFEFVTAGNTALVLIVAIALCAAISVLVFTLKYISLLRNDIQVLMPPKTPGYFSLIVMGILLIGPLIGGMGVLWTLFIWIVASYLYMRRKEKLYFACLWLAILAILPLNIARVSVVKAFDDGFLQTIHYVRSGGYSARAIDSIRHYLVKYPEKNKLHFMMGLLYKHGDRYFDSLKEYLEYARLVPSDASGHINLGNIYFVLNNLGEAISEYRRAENTDPGNAAVYYNLSKAYFHQFKFAQATEMLKRASNLDPQLVAYYTEIHSTNPNRLLIDASIPDAWFWEEVPPLLSSALADQDRFWIKLGPNLNFAGTALTLAIMTLILLIIQMTHHRFMVSRYCVMCGQPTSVRMRKDAHDGICSLCDLAVMKKGQIESEKRESRLKGINRRTRRKSFTAVTLSILYPGAGELYLGKLNRGCCFTVLWSFLLAGWFTADLRLNAFGRVPAVGDTVLLALHLGFMVLIYILSLFSIVRGLKE